MGSGIIYRNRKARKRAAKIKAYGRMSKRGVRAWEPSDIPENPVTTYFVDPDTLHSPDDGSTDGQS